MTEAAPAIEVRGARKRFKLYHHPVWGPLRELLFFWRRDRQYREHFAVDNVDLTIRRGEVVGIVGPNGAGKTTLLKMIAGLLPVDGGSIAVHGKVTALLALGVGLHPEFTGRESIVYGGMLLGMKREEIERKAPGIVEFADIGMFIDQPMRTYSSGMRARLLFSISMSIDPDILIVDEALATGDIAFVQKCEVRIRELCRSGATVLFVSHNMTQIMNLCDRSILMLNGRIVFDGEPHETFDIYRKLYVERENEALAALRKNEQFNLVAGDGSLKLNGVDLRDAGGEVTQAFFTGRPMEIALELDYQGDDPLHVFVGFLMSNHYVGHIDSEHLVTADGIRTEAFLPRRRVVIRIDRVVMLNGTFSMWLLFIRAKDRSTLAEYRNVARFRVAKEHHPFDFDAYFAQPVASLRVE